MNKYEQLIEHIINDETDKARALFHDIVVEKSRDIYESLVGEDDINEIGGNQVQGLRNEVTMDEQGISEEDEFNTDDEFASDDTENDFDQDDAGDDLAGDEFGGAEGEDDGELPATKNDIMGLESALDELKAEFDALMNDGDADDEFGGDTDVDADDEFGADDAGSEFGAENGEEENEFGESIVREYVEKVAAPSKTETGAPNTKSLVAGKNDMGGSAKNLNQGKAEGSAPNAPQKASNYGTKGQGTQPVASRNMNVPGGKAGSAFKSKESVNREGEGQTTDAKVAVATKSPLAR